MKFNDAVLSRRSIRAFLPDPVPREKIIKIIDISRWAPSWGNIQPWEIVVADGEKTKLLAEAFVNESKKGLNPRPDINMPVEYLVDQLGLFFHPRESMRKAMAIFRGRFV